MTRGRERPLTTALGWRLPSWLLDVGPVALIVLEGVGALTVGHRPPNASSVLLLIALTVSAAALLVRHRAPLVTLGVVLAVALTVGYGPVVLLPVLLAVFTVAEYSDRPHVLAAIVVTTAVVVATIAIHGPALSFTDVFSRLVAVGLAVAVGLYLRARADYITGLRDRAERLERERELLAAQAVAEERVRIARELHDVVAHNVSLMVVQAQALAATGGEDAPTTLHRVADLGREALSEMHRMLGLLRVQNGDAPELEPQPGVRDLPRLIERTREAGLETSLDVCGPTRELPAAVDLSVYRIVQEALTNVVRHASATRAAVTLTYAPTALEVTVRDDGVARTDADPTPSGGHGLVGMRERVALFGGDLEAGRVGREPGYLVRALLPVQSG
ncbi:MAG: histidine kinase [Solirubrobacteraceae bacterium]